MGKYTKMDSFNEAKGKCNIHVVLQEQQNTKLPMQLVEQTFKQMEQHLSLGEISFSLLSVYNLHKHA